MRPEVTSIAGSNRVALRADAAPCMRGDALFFALGPSPSGFAAAQAVAVASKDRKQAPPQPLQRLFPAPRKTQPPPKSPQARAFAIAANDPRLSSIRLI